MGAVRVWQATHSVDWGGQEGCALTRQLPQNVAQSILRSQMGTFISLEHSPPVNMYRSEVLLVRSLGAKQSFAKKICGTEMISKFQKIKGRLEVTWEPACPKAPSDKQCQLWEPTTVRSTPLRQPTMPGFPKTCGVVKPLKSSVLACSHIASTKGGLRA